MSNKPSSESEIKALKEDIIKKLSATRKPMIIDSCLDVMLSQISESFNKDLNEMFAEYFTRGEHDPLAGKPGPGENGDRSLYKYFDSLCGSIILLKAGSDSKTTHLSDSKGLKKSTGSEKSYDYRETTDNLGCCVPCGCLTLAGNRVIKDLDKNSFEVIKNVEYPDAFFDYFLEKTDLDKIGIKILSDLEFGGKFAIRYSSIEGFISQLAIDRLYDGKASLKKQRTSKSLKTIGMKVYGDYAGLTLSDMQIVSGMNIALQLFGKLKEFCDYRKVVNTIESIAGRKESAGSIASIHKSIELLYRASEKFEYGTNAHRTVESIAEKFFYIYLVLTATKQIGLSQERLDDIIDAARNLLLLNRVGTPSEISKTRIYIDLAKGIRDLLFQILAPAPDLVYWSDNDFKNLRDLIDLNEAKLESFIASFKEATGIELADKKWLREDIVIAHDLPNKL